jgi:hypothetical protein
MTARPLRSAVCAAVLFAAPALGGANAWAQRVATAARAATPPVIDGSLDEAVWQEAPVLSDFVQADPFEGQAATEKTDVRLLYDAQAFYVGVTLHDSDPSKIVTTETRRDSFLGDQDSFQVIFDTFRDRQNGFVFGTTSTGVQYDAQVRNEGAAASNWDASWEVKTHHTSAGWTAEFRIPLRTLRYGSPPQLWGLNFQRNIQRTRERVYWAPLARQYDLSRLSSAGELRALSLPAPRNFTITPYALTSANRNFTPGASIDGDADVGLDAKFGITPSLNLDATYNTDFAQVEVDTQQINLTRFNIRFPEKRPFFLENSQLFQVGKNSGGGMGGASDLDLFFSRRIGLDDSGNLVPIKGGARLTGKAGGFNVGLLNMQTDERGSSPGNNFTALRLSRELPKRSGIGAIFANRSATGDRAGLDNWNRTWGADGRLGVGEHFAFTGFAARTETPGLHGRDHAWNVDSVYDNGHRAMNLEFGETGEDFNPEVGYIDRTQGYRRWYTRFSETLRQDWVKRLGFRELFPHANYARYTYLDTGRLQSAELHVDNHFDWEKGYRVDTAVNGTWEGLDRPFEVYRGVVVPAGEHGGLRAFIRANTDRRKWISANYALENGAFLTGTQNGHTVGVIARQGGQLVVSGTWTRRAIDLPEGAFVTNLGSLRVTYNFTTDIFAQSLIQYNDVSKRWSTNLRVHWLQTAAAGLYVVYNDTETINGLGPVNRALIVKYSQQLDILR